MFDPNSGQWSPIPSMPQRRRDHGCAVLGDWVYLVGGWDMQPYYSSVIKFNVRSHSYSQCAPLSGPRGWVGVAALGEYVYCVGGYDDREKDLATVERYDPRRDHWERLSNLNNARGGCGLVALAGALYVVGGYNGKKSLKSVEKYIVEQDRWVEVHDLVDRREDLSHATTVMTGRIVIAGGVDDKEQVLNSMDLYNPDQDKWSRSSATLVLGKRGLALAVLDGVLYGFGGEDSGDQNLEMTQRYDIDTGRWQPWHRMREQRAGHAVAVVPGSFALHGGSSGGFVAPSQDPPPYSAI